MSLPHTITPDTVDTRTMDCCPTCTAIPWRQLLYIVPPKDYYAWRDPDTDEEDKRYRSSLFHPWHSTISHLHNNASSCSFCGLINANIKSHFRYNIYVKEHDERPLWLEIHLHLSYNINVWIGEESNRQLITIPHNFNTTLDSPMAPHFRTHSPIRDTFHPMVLGRIPAWVEQCEKYHTGCAHEFEADLPTRLLDLSKMPATEQMTRDTHDWPNMFQNTSCHLKESHVGEKGRYVSLSYCWGKSLPFTTTNTNVQQHKQSGISFDQIPATLQDAIYVARYLGIDYLWADCLCIIQDDKHDWEHEAAKMSDVYSKAYLTISATRASHCREGFLKERDDSGRTLFKVRDEAGEFTLHFLYSNQGAFPGAMESVDVMPLTNYKDEPILGRAWCFQERLLSPRTIHFSSKQMYWECASSFKEEERVLLLDHDTSTRLPVEFSILSIEKALYEAYEATRSRKGVLTGNAWFRMVEDYTSRELTKASDKLPAISGVIAQLQQATGDTCYAGHWKSWFLRGLLWRVQTSSDLYIFTSVTPKRPDFYRAPSWSFAAVEGVIQYTDVLYATFTYCSELMEVSLTPKGKNPLLELTSGFARINAPLTGLQQSKPVQGIYPTGMTCLVKLKNGASAYGSVDYDVDVYEECDVLMITTATGLAVKKVDGKVDTYERIGVVFVTARVPPDHEDGSEIQSVVIQKIPADEYPDRTLVTII